MGQVSAAGQLALWIGRRGRGAARLTWGEQELTLFVAAGHVVGVEGDDGEVLAASFGLGDAKDWFRQAQAAVEAGQVSQGEATAVVKRALSEALRRFFLAPDGKVTFQQDAEATPDEFTISYPHLAVEMTLGASDEALVSVFLPDPSMVLRRLPEFARRAGGLGLTDEGMLVLAKINDTRTAREIAEPSPHGDVTAYRLLASAVAAGLAEATPRLEDMTFASIAEPLPEPRRGRRWWLWFLILLLGAGAAAFFLFGFPWDGVEKRSEGGSWAVAVDMRCQPADLERLFRRQERHSDLLRIIPTQEGEEACFWLIWGSFATREDAAQAAVSVPPAMRTDGFPPHVVPVGQEP